MKTMKKILFPALVLLALAGISVGAHYSSSTPATQSQLGPSHAAVTQGTYGDITSVVAGTGLSGGATSGAATLNVNIAGGTCSAGQAVTAVSATGTATCAVVASVPGSSLFGDGHDGAITFDGTTTILGMAPATVDGVAQVYTLDHDISPSAMTINVGVTVRFANYRIFVLGTATINGHLSGDGRPGVGRINGTTFGSQYFASLNNGGGSGANGGGNGNNGSTSGTAIFRWVTVGAAAANANGASFGQGGGGGTAGGGTGGTGGSVTTVGSSTGEVDFLSAMTDRTSAGFGSSYTAGSGGGGGGCVAASSSTGGGGGAGGSWVFFGAKTIAGSGTITDNGGAGGNATLVDTGCGGGGGGGGGVLNVYFSTATGTVTATANGGTHGTKVSTGNDGGNGSAGTVSAVNLSGDGTHL